jgi:hypothetical protein
LEVLVTITIPITITITITISVCDLLGRAVSLAIGRGCPRGRKLAPCYPTTPPPPVTH